jgi:hypothetical protein
MKIKYNQDAGAPAGGGNPPAPAAGTPPPATPPATPPAAAPTPTEWTASLPDPLKGYVQTKQFKDPGAVVEAYQNLEKLMGSRDQYLKKPEGDDPQAWNDLFSKLGKPAKADEYKIEVPAGGDPEFANWAKGTFHELNLTGTQAEKLAAKYQEYANKTMDAQNAAYTTKMDQQEVELKREWGAAYEQNINAAKKAAKAFGLNDELVDQFEKQVGGFAPFMKFLNNIGSKIGEDSFVTGQRPSTMTPQQALNKIEALKQDRTFYEKLMKRDAAAVKEWDDLNTWAAS